MTEPFRVGDAFTYRGFNYVVEEVTYRWGVRLCEIDGEVSRSWGHWTVAKKLRKDNKYNPNGEVISFFHEEEGYRMDRIGRMRRTFHWPIEKPKPINTMFYRRIQVC